ncbi:MAG: hypothetical protein GTO24_02230 [candidate division Zixibacteria bacterium]|nr:hypothetical protein [candidate division Zixibacteria bacterium]
MRKTFMVSLWIIIIIVLLNFSLCFGWYDVCIDPGHGGSDSATVGPVYGVFEKDANLEWAGQPGHILA